MEIKPCQRTAVLCVYINLTFVFDWFSVISTHAGREFSFWASFSQPDMPDVRFHSSVIIITCLVNVPCLPFLWVKWQIPSVSGRVFCLSIALKHKGHLITFSFQFQCSQFSSYNHNSYPLSLDIYSFQVLDILFSQYSKSYLWNVVAIQSSMVHSKGKIWHQ